MNGKKIWALVALIILIPIVIAVLVLGGTLLVGISKDKNTWMAPANMQVDASHIHPVSVEGVVNLSPDSAQALVQLRGALQQARARGLKIAIAGARHSMGGQTAYPNGIVIDMLTHNRMNLDSSAGTAGMQTLLHVQAGARWSDVISFLDARGYAVRIMQSNNPFTVGGTLSVNAHGWQHNQPPFGSTVEDFNLLTADGEVKHCSRSENSDLFHLVIGGYGLFGVVLDVDLRVMHDESYRAERFRLPAREYPARYAALVNGDTTVGLVYGRLSIAPSSFLREAILTRYVRTGGSVPKLSHEKGGPGLGRRMMRALFLAGVGNSFGKEVRWQLEKWVGGESDDRATRNSILDDPTDLSENRDSSRTQLLHEYFIPRDSLEAFLIQARRIIPGYHGDLLNVTVRSLCKDTDAYLNYARQDVFSLVMTFSQQHTPTGDSGMRIMTRALIDASLASGGAYYLPYRLHATREQFFRVYPMAESFFTLKRKYDPEELFQNGFYTEYAAR